MPPATHLQCAAALQPALVSMLAHSSTSGTQARPARQEASVLHCAALLPQQLSVLLPQ
jgi:hypothetical protein